MRKTIRVWFRSEDVDAVTGFQGASRSRVSMYLEVPDYYEEDDITPYDVLLDDQITVLEDEDD